jgi:hypothetical protein
MNNDPCKAFEIFFLKDKYTEKQTKITTHMDLWKYGKF